jgi:tRNA(adenine34) deaminase
MTMMRRCVALAQSAGSMGEYPFAAVIGRRGEFICESINMVRSQMYGRAKIDLLQARLLGAI